MNMTAQEYVYSYTLTDGFKKEFTLNYRVNDDQAKRIAEIIQEDDIRVSSAHLAMRIRKMGDGLEQATYAPEYDELDLTP